MTLPDLWSHQVTGIRWCLERSGAYLHLPMGAGKSRCVVEVCRETHATAVLIVCPKAAVASVWPNQFAEFDTQPWDVIPWTQLGSSTAMKPAT